MDRGNQERSHREVQRGAAPPVRAYFSVALVTLCGLGNLESGLGILKVWSTFSVSYAFCYAEVFLSLLLYMLLCKVPNKIVRHIVM